MNRLGEREEKKVTVGRKERRISFPVTSNVVLAQWPQNESERYLFNPHTPPPTFLHPPPPYPLPLSPTPRE
jgi:hypothetical protein